MSNVNAPTINDRNDLYTRYGSIEKINQLALHTIEFTPQTPAYDLKLTNAVLDIKNITILNVYGLIGDNNTSTSIPVPLGFAKIFNNDEHVKQWELHLLNHNYHQKKIQKIYINYTQ